MYNLTDWGRYVCLGITTPTLLLDYFIVIGFTVIRTHYEVVP